MVKTILKKLAKIILASILVVLLIWPASSCCQSVLDNLLGLWDMMLEMSKQVYGRIVAIVYGSLMALVNRFKGDVSISDCLGLALSAYTAWCLLFRSKQCVRIMRNAWSRVGCFWGCVTRILYAATSPLRRVMFWYARRHMATSGLCRWLIAKQRERRGGCDFSIRMLTPIDTAKNVDCYKSMLAEALKNEKITNIAITGRYGAGKSTFLQTYFREYNVLWVSLAAFIGQLGPGNAMSGGRIKGKNDASLKYLDGFMTKLEWSILQQIVYAAHGNHLPFSRFARISHSAIYKSVVFGLFATLIVSCSFAFLQPSRFFAQYNGLPDGAKMFMHVIALMCGLFILVPLVFSYLHRWFVRRRPHLKVETPAFGVDLSNSDGMSVFNRALDELIYFFERLHYDAVVFEDIDRVDQPLLFTKLREINHILNKSRQIPQAQKPIRFIYAVRDDLFAYDERVKFFDFILPIFPEFNAEKSNGFIMEDIKTILGMALTIDEGWESFVRLFSYHISDRRLWNNIYNEFSLAHHSTPPHLDRKKMLAMILFKNVFPRDYDLAHSRKGILPFVLGFDGGHVNNWRSLQIKRLNKGTAELVAKRRELLETKAPDSEIDAVDQELNINRHKLARLRRFSIKALVEHGDFTYEMLGMAFIEVLKERHDTSKDIRDSRLLLLFRLIEKGMIDEQYEDYLTNTPHGAMSSKDFLFIYTLLNGGDVSNLDVDRPLQIIDQLNRNVFRTRFIRNVKFAQGFVGLVMSDELEAGLQTKFDNYIARNFSDGTRDSADFLVELLTKTKIPKDRDKWIERIYGNSAKFLGRVFARNDITEGDKLSLCGYCLGFAERNLYEKEFGDLAYLIGLIRNYIPTVPAEGLDQIIKCSSLSSDEFCDFLEDNSMSFEVAAFFDLADVKLRDLILSMGLYMPTAEIVSHLLRYKGLSDEGGKMTAPYYAIINSGDSVLKEKVHNDTAEFLKTQYAKLLGGEKGLEPQSTLVELLKRDDVPLEVKSYVLCLQEQGRINSIESLSDEMVRLVLQSDMLVPTWKAVVETYKKIDYNERMRDFVVKHAEDLSKDDFSSTGGDMARQCINKILRDAAIPDDIVLRLSQSINRESRYWYSTVDFPPGRLAVFCKSKLIRFSAEGYEKLKSRRDGSHLVLARCNIKQFLDEFTDSWLDERDAVSLLSVGTEFEIGVGILLMRKASTLIKNNVEVKKLLAAHVRIRDFESRTRFTKEMMTEIVDYMESPTCRVYTLLMMKNLSQDEMWQHLIKFPGGCDSRGVVAMQVSTKVANRINERLSQLGFVTRLYPAKRMPKLEVWRKVKRGQ